MSLTFSQARDEMYALFKASWDADTPAITGTVPRVQYGRVERVQTLGEAGRPASDDPWARIVIRHAGGTESLAGAIGAHTYERSGFVSVQVFVPLNADGGPQDLEDLSMLVRNVFEGNVTAGGVWFRRCEIREVGVEEKYKAWVQNNVLCDFVYDEVK